MQTQTLTRRTMLTLMSTPLAVAGSGLFTEAHAETFWGVIGNVQIGGVHISVGVHSQYAGRYGVHPGYYYRTTHRLKYRKHRCGEYCYRRSDYDYHHESCPLLGAHVEYYGAPPACYGPQSWGRGNGYRYEGYGYSYRDRGHGHGRRHRHNRGRGRGHRRGQGRGRW